MSFSASGLHARQHKTIRCVAALVLREMSTTYGKSPGGYLWAFLEPVGGLAIMTVAFSMAFHSPALGNNFPLFYATGYLPFMMYSDIAVKVGQSMRFSKPLLFYPSVTFFDAIIARFLLNGLTHLLVFYVMIFCIFNFFDTTATLDHTSILNSMCMALSLGLGVGILNCFLFGKFPIWERVWVIVTRPMFIISCIFYLFETLPTQIREYLWFNPIAHVVGEMRRGFYPTYDAVWVSPAYVYFFSLSLTLIGLIFLSRYHRDLLNS